MVSGAATLFIKVKYGHVFRYAQSAHPILEPLRNKINPKGGQKLLQSTFVNSLIQNAFNITCGYQLFSSGTVINMFNCEKCQYKAESNNLLKIHNKYFHMDGKFTCDICGHQESRKQSLKRHKMILHEGLKYSCNQCEYRSTIKQSLVQHQRSVHEGIRYRCILCSYEATQKGNLKEHQKSVHDGVKYPCKH